MRSVGQWRSAHAGSRLNGSENAVYYPCNSPLQLQNTVAARLKHLYPVLRCFKTPRRHATLSEGEVRSKTIAMRSIRRSMSALQLRQVRPRTDSDDRRTSGSHLSGNRKRAAHVRPSVCARCLLRPLHCAQNVGRYRGLQIATVATTWRDCPEVDDTLFTARTKKKRS